jgi:release factor glutamine methyltransferase
MRRIDYQPMGKMTKISINDWLISARKELSKTSDLAYLETQVILSHVTEKSREWLISHPEHLLSEKQLLEADAHINQLIEGVPLPYITGKQAFFGLDFIVSPDVLIPRPETEQLVEECIQWLEEHPTKRKMVDVGTGSGIIAITLADRFSDLEVTAVDLSDQALEVAQSNADRLKVAQNTKFLKSDLLEKCDEKFDLIAANLPYIPSGLLQTLSVSKHEPILALDGGEDGLDLISRLLVQSISHMTTGGMTILEIESSQAQTTIDLANTLIPRAKKTLLNDLATLPRILKINH